MSFLSQDSPTTQAIYAHYKKVGDAEPSRDYLGASIIGHPCSRYLWYTFRACCKPDFSGRLYRLFETGNIEEDRVIEDLKSIGYGVKSIDPETGEQYATSFCGGQFSGHLDGIVTGIPESPKTEHVLEVKSYNAKAFTKLCKDGVKKANPQHYCQMQVYMHGRKLKRALYVAVNKNTDAIYTERIHYNKEEAEALVERARQIITAQEPPPRISESPDAYQCNQYGQPCDAHAICWGCERVLPIATKSCKQCCYATPNIDKGCWECEKHHVDTPHDDAPCANHLCLPGLFPFAEPIDFTGGMIVFQNKDDGKKWEHGGFCYTTEELLKLSRSEL